MEHINPAELWNNMWDSSVSSDGFVSAVDPADMKQVCQMGRETPADAIVASALQGVCSPESNAIAVSYRLKMLAICDLNGLLSAYTPTRCFAWLRHSR